MQLSVVSIEKPMLNKRFVNYVAALPERTTERNLEKEFCNNGN
jgi:hypothetical protein